MLTPLAVLAIPLLLAAAPPSDAASQPASSRDTGFLRRTLALDGQMYAYAVYVPADYTPDRAWPLILFLHGSGERGDDGWLQTDVGLGRAIRRNYRAFPAIVVFPQCRPNQVWAEPPEELGPMGRMALACVEQTSREFRCDPRRLYLTGLSLGGMGSWVIAAAHGEQFAAAAPVCGFVELQQDTGVADRVASKLVNFPIWTFHGDEDKSVPVERTRELVAAIRRLGGTKVFYTEYPQMGHNVWDKAYGDAALWRWMFEQQRR